MTDKVLLDLALWVLGVVGVIVLGWAGVVWHGTSKVSQNLEVFTQSVLKVFGDFNARIASLDTRIRHIEEDVHELKSDVKDLFVGDRRKEK